MCDLKRGLYFEVADLSPKNIFGNKQAATDGTDWDLNIGETRVWRLDSGPNLQPCSCETMASCYGDLYMVFLFPVLLFEG